MAARPRPPRRCGATPCGRIRRQRSAVIGLTILGFLVIVAVFAPLIATHDPNASLLGIEEGVIRRSGPCIHLLGCPASEPQHLFGTDGNFRDVFSRVVYGTRISLMVGFAAVGFAILIGAAIGAIAGFVGGRVDNVLMRFMDVLLAFPSLLLAIAIVTVVGPKPGQCAPRDRHRLDPDLRAHHARLGPRRRGSATS